MPALAAGTAGGMLRSAAAGVACAALLLLLAAAPLPTADALMFHSRAVTKEWDTWVFAENGTYYAYYLVTEVSYGEGFGVATSTDGFNFTDHGYVWHGPVQPRSLFAYRSVRRALFNAIGDSRVTLSLR